MKKLTLILIIALIAGLSGCGTDKSGVVPFIARGQSDNYAPHLFTLDLKTHTTTQAAIPLPYYAQYVASNSDATKAAYCYNAGGVVSAATSTANEITAVSATTWDIYLMGTDGIEKQLTTGADACEAAFSPDGQTIAYVSIPASGFPQIFTMDADGKNQKSVVSSATGAAWMPQFSPDGKSLVFFMQTVGMPGVEAAGQFHGQSRSGGFSWGRQVNRLHGASVNKGAQPQAPVPAGSGWYTVALTGSNATPTLALAMGSWWGPPTFSADGKKLLVTLYDGNSNIYSVNLDGTGLTALTTDTTSDSFSAVPYEGLILYNRYNNSTEMWDIYAMDQTGALQVDIGSSTDTNQILIDSYWQEE